MCFFLSFLEPELEFDESESYILSDLSDLSGLYILYNDLALVLRFDWLCLGDPSDDSDSDSESDNWADLSSYESSDSYHL